MGHVLIVMLRLGTTDEDAEMLLDELEAEHHATVERVERYEIMEPHQLWRTMHQLDPSYPSPARPSRDPAEDARRIEGLRSDYEGRG